MKDHFFPREDNSDNFQNVSSTEQLRQFYQNLAQCTVFVKRIQVCSNERLSPSPRGGYHDNDLI